MAQTSAVTLNCLKCGLELARREILMLATIPPSHCHLAVREGKEDVAYIKLTKLENPKGGKSAQYCPFVVYCRGCSSHVGNITILASKNLICYKIDNVYICHDGEEIKARRLKNITRRLEEQCGIEVVNVSPEGEAACRSPRPSEALIYCDTSGLAHTSQEIGSLTCQNPRDYQRELFLSAISGNTLIYLPTGSGKTLIAAMVLNCMKKLNPNKLMVFLVDSVPLAYQQSDYIKSQVPDLKVETLVGEMESSHQRKIHQRLAHNEVDLLVLTHQIFLNFLAVTENPPVRLTDVSVLIFDEAHHCRGNHQYKQIMEYYKNTPNKFKPVVLGLTASPAEEITVERTILKLEELLDNLCCSIAMPILTSSVIHENIPDTSYDVSESMSNGNVVLRCIRDHVEYLKTILQTDGAPGRQTLQELPLFSPNFRGALRWLIDSCHGNKKRIKTLVAGEHAMHMLSVADLNEVLGYQHAKDCLRDCIYRTFQAVSPKESALKKLIGSQPTFLALKGLVDSRDQEDSSVSDRYNILVKRIGDFVTRAQVDETSRGIIFVSMRKTAYKLCEQIRTIPDVTQTLNPKPFVGHGQGSYDGMAWREEQEALLKQFRSGVTKLLVCTSVLEEGLDVPQCNLVIRFQGAATLRALVQTRGRASRRPDSTFVVICNETEKKAAEDLIRREQNMEEAIGLLMESHTTRSQAEEFVCEVKKPKLFFPEAEDSSENKQIERYNPSVTVFVHNLTVQKHRVIDFLNTNFEVMSSKVIPSTSVSREATESNPTSQHMEFELQPNDNSDGEFRSREEFIRHVTEVWCSRLTNQDEEPLPVWLQSSLPKKRSRPGEPFHWLKANSLFLGTFIDRCHFRSEWPSGSILKNVQINFDHSLKILSVLFSVQGNSYKLELRYDELEDFIVVDSDMNTEVNRAFLSVRHPPRLYQVVQGEQDADDGILDEQDADNGILDEQDADNGILDEQDADNGILDEQDADDGVLDEQDADDGILDEQDAADGILDEQDADNGILDEQDADNGIILDEQDADNGILDEQDADNGIIDEQDADDGVLDEQDADDGILDEQDAADGILDEQDIDDGVLDEQDADDGIFDEQDAEDDVNDSLEDRSDSESDGFSTDEEYPDVVRNYHDRSSTSSSQNDEFWERVSDIGNSENAWSQCFTYCLAIPSRESIKMRRLLTSIERRFDKKVFYCRVKESFGRLADVNIPFDLPFDVKYAAQSIVSFHPAIRGRQPGTFVGLLQSKPPNMVINALEKLKKALEQDKFCDPGNTVKTKLNRNSTSTSGIQNRLVPSHCATIKRAVITPTRLLLYPPEVMVKNRVLRNHETDDFLCVSIRDEDLSKLSAARGSVDFLLDDVQHVLDEGLGIGGQRFHFLGSSNSQLRNHSCWFVGPSLQPDKIRGWMGDFSHIKCVASYMARMGQCFSTSMDAVGFAISEGTFYGEEDDVKTDDHKYCFSDGVGRISEELVAEVVKKIAKPFKPSAFQIRFAGYKGVLALDPSLSGKRALFRPSMRKFESRHRRLEVLQTSRPQAVYLNHQVIMLLSNLGVPDEVFIKLQNDMLDQLAGMLVNEHDAIQLLGSGAKMGITYHSLSSAGIPLTTEPFFKSLLVAMYRNSIHELLSRARIRLPPAWARLMMGVMDESGVLKPGQVFVQCSEESTRADREDEFNKNHKHVLRGPVVVTRNPCLHPGDVRQLEAVEVPQLNHLVDCIVFPRRGSRPHPNEMAGGDLDGDLYFVCWDESLLPRKPNFPPMEYPALQKLEQDEPITAADMTKFVVDYIRSDQLGVIDNAHKALADVEKGGVESKICLHLAELHSLAVDAPKTGKWPKMPKMKPLENYPDFMMKSDKASYPSDKLLGKLYRRCRKFKDTASEKHGQKMRVDSSFLLSGNGKYIEEARKVNEQYRTEMEALMRLYGIETEAEVFTGCFLKLRNRLRKEKTEIAEIVGERVFAIRSEFRRNFFRDFDQDGQSLVESAQVSNEMLLKVSAWYQVAYTHAHEHEDDSDPVHGKRLLGLPWFINDVMLALKQRKEPPGSISAQTLNVSTVLGQSLIIMFNGEKGWLLEDLKIRVRIKNRICSHLTPFQPNHSLTMIGSSATLLFHQKSDLDLCVLPQTYHTRSRGVPGAVLKEDSPSIEDQAKALQALIPHLKEETQSKKQEQENENATNLFWKARLVNKKNYPVLVCKRPTKKLRDGTNCPSTLSCDLSSSPDSLNSVILLSSYITSYPRLLLLLRVVHRWCCVTGVSRNAAGAANLSNILATLLLVQCMRKGLIDNFNEDHIVIKWQQLVQGDETDGAQYMEWEKVIDRLEKSCSENPNTVPLTRAQLDTAQLGMVLMTFFQTHDSSFEEDLPDSLARTLHVRKLAELLDKEHLLLVKEHMQRAYQLLALYGDVQIMLAISGSEDYSVIFLSPLLTTYLAGVEKSKAQEIAKKSGATSIVIRPSFSRSRASAILEVKGSEPAIRAVERELEEMSTQASSDRMSLMSGCFVEDASLLLFEGSRNQNDRVTLTPYDGPCHQTHDNLARHLALLDPEQATFNEYAFRRFTEKFFQQLRLLERDFDSQLHGCYEFAVHFGRVYMFSVPHSLLEDSESITIAMLRANKRKSKIPQENREFRETEKFVNPEAERARRRRRRPKRAVSTDETRKKRVRAKPSRSSFFTVVHSPEGVEEFLEKFGFQPDANTTEKFLVDICDEEVEFYVRFDNKFSLVEIKFPNLRWCMVDVKRPWQRRPDHDLRQDDREADDDVTLDGWEIDIRFLLQTRYALGPCDIRDTKYAKYQRILGPSNTARPFKVQEDLWKHVRLVRAGKLKKFTHVSTQGGFLSGLAVYLDEVTEYSRPKTEVDVFGREVTRWEVSLEASLPTDDKERISFQFPAKEAMKSFLQEIWQFAFSLSSLVSYDMEQED